MRDVRGSAEQALKKFVKSLPGAEAAVRYVRPPAPDFTAFARRVDDDLMRSGATCDMERLFYGHQGRLAHKWHHYLAIYDRVLTPFRAGFPTPDGGRRSLRLLEIGVSHGGSLEIWRKFLGPSAIIFGIDVNPACQALDTRDLPVRIGSQDDEAFLRAVVAEMGGVDIVVEDGSHVARHQAESFRVLFPLLSQGGLYLAEDLHTSYWRNEFDGGYQRRGTFIEQAKQLVDDMHAWYHGRPTQVAEAHRAIGGISFHDSLIIIEKRANQAPFHTTVGTPSF
jgi:hypothetical protein